MGVKSGGPPMKQAEIGSRAASPIRLRGRKLFLARVIWIAVASIAMGLFVVGVPADYAHYSTVCPDSECGGAWRLEPEDVSVVEKLGLSVSFYAAYNVALDIMQTVGFWVLGAFIFWRRSDDLMALFISLMLVSFGSLGAANYALYAFGNTHPTWWPLIRFVESIALISFFTSFYLFPDGHFVPRWTRVPIAVFIACQVPYVFFPWFDQGISSYLYSLLLLCLLGILIFAQIYRYARVSRPVERQQTKWVVFALTAVITILVVTGWVGLAFSGLRQSGVPGMLYTLGSRTVWNLSLLFIPLSIAGAIVRYRLWDIDILINRTLVYSSLTAILVVFYFGAVTATQEIFRALTSQEEQPQLAIVLSTLVIAALFNPLRRRIQAFIDRRFYRSKYDAKKTLEAFSARLSHETDLDALSEDLVEAVRETIQPAHVSLWLRPDTASKEETFGEPREA
jgi:hypothetical protein